jgi:hypothetical protein
MAVLRRLSVTCTTLAVCAALLAGCGDKPPEDIPVTTSAKPRRPVVPGAADMVAAVTLSGKDTPVELRFALRARPQVNQSLELEFMLLPTRDIEGAQLSFEPTDSVELVSENPFFSVGRSAAGASTTYKVKVLPKQAGILSLNATVAVDLPTGPVARAFSIPLIVSAATPASAPATPAP